MLRKGKDRSSEPETDPNGWMTTFADLVMLLLTFFVLLLTMKSMDAGTVREMFVRTYGPLDYIRQQDMVEDVLEFDHYIKSAVINTTDEVNQALELLEGIDPKLAKNRPPVNLREIMDTREGDMGVVISLEADELFALGEAEIRTDRLHILDQVGRLFHYAANDILVMGHTDDIPIRGGRFASNAELSVYRALSVLYYLTDAQGLRPDRLAAGGHGDSLPRYPNDSPENRAKNRRVEFFLRKPM